MTVITRARRNTIERMSRLLVLASATTAVLTLGMLVRSWEGTPARFGTDTRQVDHSSMSPVNRPDSMEAAGDAETGRPTGPRRPSPLEDLRSRLLSLPVEGTRPEQLVSSFGHERGARRHEAIDILAPTGTPVVAVESGRIEKLFVSERGGLTVYHFDPLRRYAYYYAHLSRYADGLREGHDVKRGEVIGYVGVSGNAPPDTPHLHFAIFELGPEQQWWKGVPIDPYLVWRPESD